MADPRPDRTAASAARRSGTARPGRGPNAERHAQTRAALLATGRRVFGLDGYATARTRDLVAGTGLTRGALYHHFADKRALFEAVIEQLAVEIVARVDAVAEAAPTSLEGLRRGCREWFDAMADPAVRRLYLVEGPAVLGLPRWREIDNRHGGGSLRAGLQAAIDESGDRTLKAEPLAALLIGALNEAALWVSEVADRDPARQTLDASVDTVLHRLFRTGLR